MDKETLSHYGWLVVVVIILSIVITFTTPFGKYIASGASSVLKSFSKTVDVDVDSTELDAASGKVVILEGKDSVIDLTKGASFAFRSSADVETFKGVKVDSSVVSSSNYTVTSGSTIITFTKEYAATLSRGNHTVEIISSGGTAVADFFVGYFVQDDAIYVNASGQVLTAGKLIPEAPTTGDTFTYGDYEYTYDASKGGWMVVVLDKTKAKYGEILTNINGANITALISTFDGCSALTSEGVPSIPNTVTDMQKTFAKCSSLVDASKIVIPERVTNLFGAFSTCANLTTPPDLSKATSVKNMSWMFTACSKLATAPVIPESATNLHGCFNICTSLTSAPIIPQEAVTLGNLFYKCSALSGKLTINSSPTAYVNCITGTQITEIVGDCPDDIKTQIMATK